MEIKKSRENGFTLIDLLIVLAIVALLAAIVIPSVTGMFGRGSEEALDADARIIQTAVNVFYRDVHRGISNGSWGEASPSHYYPTADGDLGTLTSMSFPLPIGDPNPESTLHGIIWMGLLANSPGAGGGESPATARPQTGENGPYLNEIPESAGLYNGRTSDSGPYTWIILKNGMVAAVEIRGDNWVLASEIVGGGDVQPAESYTLTLRSTSGGSVTAPGEGEFTYSEGTRVNLFAVPDECKVFVNWTGEVDTVDNTSAADTTITMDGDYSITANFAEGEYAKVTIEIDPEIEAWIRIWDKSTEDVAIDKDGVPVDGSNHQTPASIWIPWGDYTVRVKKIEWVYEVELPLIDRSTCSVTLTIKKDEVE